MYFIQRERERKKESWSIVGAGLSPGRRLGMVKHSHLSLSGTVPSFHKQNLSNLYIHHPILHIIVKYPHTVSLYAMQFRVSLFFTHNITFLTIIRYFVDS